MDSIRARYPPFPENQNMQGNVNDTYTALADKMSKQLWILRMSCDRAWAECLNNEPLGYTEVFLWQHLLHEYIGLVIK